MVYNEKNGNLSQKNLMPQLSCPGTGHKLYYDIKTLVFGAEVYTPQATGTVPIQSQSGSLRSTLKYP